MGGQYMNQLKLWHKVTIGLILGIIFGRFASDYVNYVKPVGDIFLNLIKMIVIPLIYFSLIVGITSVPDSKVLGRISIKSTIAYLCTSIIAVCTGVLIAVILKPGNGITIDFAGADNATQMAVQSITIDEIFLNIIPSNALAAMVNNEFLQVVFFAIFTGISINKMGKESPRLVEYFTIINNLFFKMMSMIIAFSPYGAFALTAWVVGTQGMEILQSLAKLIGAVFVGMSIQYAFFGAILYFIAKLSPLPFYKKSIEYQSLAFSTSSSKATLPTAMNVCTQRLGISKISTSFVLPLGSSINMDGMAIYLGMCAVFFAQVAGIDLSPNQYFMLILTSTLGSIGAAGIPGGSMVMLPMILTSIGLPIEGVALIAGIDRILDMLRTTINMTGDVAITLLIDKTEGKLDIDCYNNMEI